MAPTQEARALAPPRMYAEDVQNYMGLFHELLDAGEIPRMSKVYNIHQIFDAEWDYRGAWITAATETHPTKVFWVWVDNEWENLRITEDTPTPMYTWIGFLTELKTLHYRAYGNCGDWMLLSAGTLSIERFC